MVTHWFTTVCLDEERQRIAGGSYRPSGAAATQSHGAAPGSIVLEEWLWSGGYPEPALYPDHRNLWMSSYIQTYIERDIRLLQNVQYFAYVRDVSRLMRGAMDRFSIRPDWHAPVASQSRHSRRGAVCWKRLISCFSCHRITRTTASG